MFAKWLERRKAKKEADDLYRKVVEESLLKKAEEANDAIKVEMLNSPCALRNNENCSVDCIHFKGGAAWLWNQFDENEPHVFRNEPRCKLWAP
jgi:hypothetical protein